MRTDRSSSAAPSIFKQPKFLGFVGCALGCLIAVLLFFNARDLFAMKRATTLWFLYPAVALGGATSLLLCFGCLGPRYRPAQAAAGVLLLAVVLIGGGLVLMVANVGALSGGK
jgi:hypothetical protein